MPARSVSNRRQRSKLWITWTSRQRSCSLPVYNEQRFVAKARARTGIYFFSASRQLWLAHFRFRDRCLMDRAQGRSSAVVLVGFLALLLGSAQAATYIVGDQQGWSLSGNYAAWAATKTFRAGDVLIFTYTQMHSVVEVSQADFASCTVSPINTFTSGNDSITLTKPAQYFICGTAGHCGSGMALQVKLAATPAPAPAPAPKAKAPKAKAPKAPSSSPSSTPGSSPSSSPPNPSQGGEPLPPSSLELPPAYPAVGSTDQAPPAPAPLRNSAVTQAAGSWFLLAIAAATLAL